MSRFEPRFWQGFSSKFYKTPLRPGPKRWAYSVEVFSAGYSRNAARRRLFSSAGARAAPLRNLSIGFGTLFFAHFACFAGFNPSFASQISLLADPSTPAFSKNMEPQSSQSTQRKSQKNMRHHF